MGIAIECRRLDKLEEAITKSDNVQGTLSYCINVSHSFVNLREYRHEVSISIHLLIESLKVATLFSHSINFCFFCQSLSDMPLWKNLLLYCMTIVDSFMS